MNTLPRLLRKVRPNCGFRTQWNRILRPGPIVIVMSLIGCNARRAVVQPSVEFTQVPPAGAGGPNTHGTIGGRVVVARSNQQIAVICNGGTTGGSAAETRALLHKLI